MKYQAKQLYNQGSRVDIIAGFRSKDIVILEEDERVICVNTNEIYENNKVASEMTGVSAGAIKRCCNGDTKSAGKDEEGNKLVWKYVKDL